MRVTADAIVGILRSCTADEREQVLAIVSRESLSAEMPKDERARIEYALARTANNVEAAARVLGCGRRTLQRRMRELGFPPGHAGRKKAI